MSLTPEQIVAEEFRLRARGYDRDEVDAYLDQLADQVEADAVRFRAVEERLSAVDADLAAAREREATLTRTLATVQDAADRARADAEAEVAMLRAETERELNVAREQAEQEAGRLRSDAQRDAEQVRAAAHHEAAEVRSQLAEVQQLDATHRAQLRGQLQAQLDTLDALPDPYTDLQARLAPAAEVAEDIGVAEVDPSDPSDPSDRSDPSDPSDPALADQDPAPAVQDPGPAVQDPAPADQDPAPAVQDPAPADQDPGPAVQDPASDRVALAPDERPDDAPGDLDPADGDGAHDPWRRRDERGQPVEPDPPIWG